MTRQDCRYLVVGSGKMAHHWAAYLNLLDRPCLRWARATHDKDAVAASLAALEWVFLAISDDSLESFHDEHLKEFAGPIYHFSGCHLSRNMYTCHQHTVCQQAAVSRPVCHVLQLSTDNLGEYGQTVRGTRHWRRRVASPVVGNP